LYSTLVHVALNVIWVAIKNVFMRGLNAVKGDECYVFIKYKSKDTTYCVLLKENQQMERYYYYIYIIKYGSFICHLSNLLDV